MKILDMYWKTDILEKIKDIKIDEYPYPNFILDDMFPQEIYKEIIENLPKNDKYKKLDYKRDVIDLKKIHFDNNVLQEVSQFLISDELMEALTEKYKEYMGERYQLKNNFYMRGLLVRDQNGYSIKPHTDDCKKIITFLIYLPKDNSMSMHGTNVHISKEGLISWESIRVPFDKFEIYKKAEFIPNRMFCFLKTNNSWHSVSKINNDIVRNFFNVQIQIP